jgi:NAD(P)-dependent dehydrogenase (short-subunit alcohol dehydrogenase family)
MKRLEGKVAVITGAANGIGLAAAERFVAEGASVLLVDLHEAALQPLAERLGRSASYLVADVSAPDSAEQFTATAMQRYGRVDAAVLNAGTEGEVAPIGTYSLAGYERVMAVNVRSVWLGLSALMPAMKNSGGSIVITSSTAGLRGTPMVAAYGASKHAVIGLMKAAAIEGAAHRIRVNTVNPGPTDTTLMRAIEKGRSPNDQDAARRAGIARIPLQRYGRTEEIANMMLFLASDEASFCTGQTYVVDGGSLSA